MRASPISGLTSAEPRLLTLLGMKNAEANDPSAEEVILRVRNRLMEYLEVVVHFREVHPPWDLNEQLEQWQDWVPLQRPFGLEAFPEPVFSLEERTALLTVDAAWEALCDATPTPIRDEPAALRLAEWTSFVEVAETALRVLQIRGRFQEGAGS
jgi:hypothetical protein